MAETDYRRLGFCLVENECGHVIWAFIAPSLCGNIGQAQGEIDRAQMKNLYKRVIKVMYDLLLCRWKIKELSYTFRCYVVDESRYGDYVVGVNSIYSISINQSTK